MSKTNPMPKKKKIVIIVVAIIASLSVCAGVIAAFSKTLVTEGTVELESAPAAAKTEIPQSADEILAYLNNMLDDAVDGNRVCVDRSVSLNVEDDSVTADMSESELAVLKYAKNIMVGNISGLYPSYDGDFGDKLGTLPHIAFDSSATDSVECVRGAVDDLGEPVDIDCYFFTVALQHGNTAIDEAPGVAATFALDETAAVPQKVKQELSPMLDVSAFSAECGDFFIEAKADCTRDEVDIITLTRNYLITADIAFKGEYAALGAHTVSFAYTVSETYDYTWAGVSFVNDETEINRGEQDILAVNAVISDLATEKDYEISFVSSDPTVAQVDNEGNIKGIAVSTEPVTVTVEFKYLGCTYTDSCLVYVTVSVEKIVVSPHSASMKKGETMQLTYVIEPGNATRKEVLWFTEDESVAVVDEAGVVTAVGSGTTKVYAVTVDGFFRSSCTVTVAN